MSERFYLWLCRDWYSSQPGVSYLTWLLVHVESVDNAISDLAAWTLHQIFSQTVGQVGLASSAWSREDKASVLEQKAYVVLHHGLGDKRLKHQAVHTLLFQTCAEEWGYYETSPIASGAFITFQTPSSSTMVLYRVGSSPLQYITQSFNPVAGLLIPTTKCMLNYNYWLHLLPPSYLALEPSELSLSLRFLFQTKQQNERKNISCSIIKIRAQDATCNCTVLQLAASPSPLALLSHSQVPVAFSSSWHQLNTSSLELGRTENEDSHLTRTEEMLK